MEKLPPMNTVKEVNDYFDSLILKSKERKDKPK